MNKLTEDDIEEWTGTTSFNRGRSYFRQGAIIHPRRQDQTFKAECLGSQAQPYRVEVNLGPKGIISGNCSCPVGGGGHCKHVAALLLTWLARPESFIEMASLEGQLAQRSKEELIDLIGKMVDRYPDLERLLNLPRPTTAGSQAPLDLKTIRQQVHQAFYGMDNEWGVPYHLGQDLQDLVELGNGYVQQQNWKDAITVYEAVIRETLDNYGQVGEGDGTLHEVVNQCVNGLGECLENTTDPLHRQAILHVLFDTYHWDIKYGGIDMGYEASDIILNQTTPTERQTLIQWMQAVLPSGSSWSDNYHRQIYGGFLLSLQDNLDDESFLALCRQTGRLSDLVERLLQLGRVDEAAAEAQQADDYSLLQLTSIFVERGYADKIEGIVYNRLSTKDNLDSRLIEWLKQRLIDRQEFIGALPLEEKLFWQRPDPTVYQRLKALAQQAGQWPRIQTEVLRQLEQKKNYTLLTQIYLLENKIEQALATLSLSKEYTLGWGYVGAMTPLSIQVAKTASATHPREALKLYMDQVNLLIQIRGRENYATAAGYLLRVRELYQRLNETTAWEKLIARIYQDNRQLRALKEELTKVGL